MKNLLSKGTANAKTAKNAIETYILYLMPHKRNSYGKNLCSNASEGCIYVCLVDAGLAAVYGSVNYARLQRTDYYLENRQAFCEQLVKELTALNKKAQKKNGIIEIRLNGTSDLDFVAILKNRTGIDILSFSHLQFYDYTKNLAKLKRYIDSPKYIQTFSRSEINENDCIEALAMGANVSVVFSHKKPFPSHYLNTEVISGDVADDVMLKVSGKILGLKAKGTKAKNDTTGFVVR